jgi:hypothetical protein
MVYLHVEYTYREEAFGGVIAAWGTQDDPKSPGHGLRILKGYADPIVAAQLLEEAVQHDAYVWVLPDDDSVDTFPDPDYTPPPIVLEGLVLVWGPDILGGVVRSTVGLPTS